MTDLSISTTPASSKYGLPTDVRFCTRCVISNQRPSSINEFDHLPTSRKPTIYFDEEGVCDACRVAESKAKTDWIRRESELQELCNKHRSKTGGYDCIVPGSGGKDSFYAAHILQTRYGMHPLLVTWAPNLYTDWGFRNLQKWQAISNHILYTPNRRTHSLLTRLAVENLFHPFQPFIIGQKNLAPKLACLYNVPLVFYGENEAEYGNPKDSNGAKRHRNYFTSHRIHLGGVSEDELRHQFGLCDADLEPYKPADPAELDRHNVEVHYLGYYLRWHPQAAYFYACEHGGFEASPERTPGTYSKYNSIDDKIDDLHYYTTWIKFGIGRASYDAAQEIRSGDITRDEGVALVRRFDGEWPERFFAEICDYLSVPGFERMDKGRFLALAEKFKSHHLWDGDRLRYVVS
jgi:N-acetyl sugar amidotransferase